MPWFRFTADFDWRPKPGVTIAYKAGSEKNVTRACAASAKAKGKGEQIQRGAGGHQSNDK